MVTGLVDGVDSNINRYRAVVAGLLVGNVNALADEISLSPETVYRSLASLVKTGRIDKVGYGRYAVLKD